MLVFALIILFMLLFYLSVHSIENESRLMETWVMGSSLAKVLPPLSVCYRGLSLSVQLWFVCFFNPRFNLVLPFLNMSLWIHPCRPLSCASVQLLSEGTRPSRELLVLCCPGAEPCKGTSQQIRPSSARTPGRWIEQTGRDRLLIIVLDVSGMWR